MGSSIRIYIPTTAILLILATMISNLQGTANALLTRGGHLCRQSPQRFLRHNHQRQQATRRIHYYNRLWRQKSAASNQDEENQNDEASSSAPTTSTTSAEAITATTTDLSQYENKSNRRDQVFSAISADGGVKVTACTVRNLVNDLMIQHSLNQVPTDALGRTLISALLMANGLPDEQVVQITMNSDGPLRGIVGIASGKGDLRGYVGTPMLGNDLPLTDAVGKGMVQIVKNHPDWPRPYNGITAIRHGDIDRDIGIYLAESEQRSCALAAATVVGGILCRAAGGYLIEQLPGVSPDVVARVEQNLAVLVERNNQSGGDGDGDGDGTTTTTTTSEEDNNNSNNKIPTNLLLQGVTPLEMAEIILDGLDMQPLQQIEPQLKCDCTEDRLVRALCLLPRHEVEEILEKEEELSARCHFCSKTWRMSPDEVRQKMDVFQERGGGGGDAGQTKKEDDSAP